MKRNGRMISARKGTHRRAVLLLIVLAVFFSSTLAAQGAHEAYAAKEGTEFRGEEVFTVQSDGNLPFLENDDIYVPVIDPVYREKRQDIVLSTVGIREHGKITVSASEIFGTPAELIVPASSFEPEEESHEKAEASGADIFLPEEEEELWTVDDDIWSGEDAWEDEDGLWADDDPWADEDDLWADDAWGDDFWEEEWEPADTGVSKDALMEDDADFWADFYIAGTEADMDLPDGSYYMDLYVNDRYQGNVEIISEAGETYINADAFRIVTSDIVKAEEKQYLASFVGRVPLSDLEVRGYEAEIDNIGYTVDMHIPTSVLDTVVLSIAGGGRRGGYFSSRPLSNAIEVANTVFNLESSYSLSMYLPLWPNFDAWNLLDLDLSVSNRARLYDVYSQFSFGLSTGRNRFNFRFGLYSFYTDFPSEGLRLSWGNISGYGRPAKGTPLGIKLEKNASYFDSTWKRQSYVSRDLVLETKSRVTVLNDGQETFSAELEMGTYRLEDFILNSGGNDIRIVVHPLDGSADWEVDFSVLYGYSLLAPGENWWGVSLLTGRENRNVKAGNPFTLSVPWLRDTYMEYDVRNFSLGFFFDVGICRGLTMRTRGSLTNNPTDTVNWSPAFRLDTTFITTTDIGGMTVSAAYWNTSKDGQLFGHNANVSYSQSFGTGISQLSSVSISLGYDWNSSVILNGMDRHTSRGALSTGGRLGFLNWSLSLSGMIDWTNMDTMTYSTSSSFSFSAGRHVSVNASASLSGAKGHDPRISLRMGVSMYLGGVSSSASADGSGNLDFRVSGGSGRHSASGSVSTNFLNGWGMGMSGYYSYFGNWVNVSSGLSMSMEWTDGHDNFRPAFNNAGLSLSLSTSSLFADGYFHMGSSIPYNYLLIRQKGALKGNILTTASGNNSSEDIIKSQFGVGMLDGVGGMRDQYITLYSQSEDGQNYHSYNVKIPRSRRNGYVLVLEEDYRYTASGLVPDWTNASSPLYELLYEEGDDGELVWHLEQTDEYIFSDETTRFLSPALLPGTYAFDVPLTDGSFRLMIFEVGDHGDRSGVIMLGGLKEVQSLGLNPIYSEYMVYDPGNIITMDEYWNILYPPVEDDFYFGDSFGDEGIIDDEFFFGDEDPFIVDDTVYENEEKVVMPFMDLFPATEINPYLEAGATTEAVPVTECDEGPEIIWETTAAENTDAEEISDRISEGDAEL